VPEPTVDIRYDAETELVHINVTAKYLAQDLAYVIRFSTFDSRSDELNMPGSCENRLASTYSGVDFQDWWKHEPTAIGSSQDLNYQNPGNWIYTVYDCGTVGWTRTLSISDVSYCKDRWGFTELINEESSNNTVIFSGNLTVSVVSPVYDQVYDGDKSSYMSKSWQYPFRLNFLSTSSAVVLFQSGGQFLDATVGSLYIQEGRMYMIINTIYYPKGYGAYTVF
jgi:hypothetical protein